MLNIKQIGQTWSEADETHRGPNTSQNYPLAAWKEQRAAVNHNSGNKKTQRWNTKYVKYKVIKVVIQIAHLVVVASTLYFTESKKDKSFLFSYIILMS